MFSADGPSVVYNVDAGPYNEKSNFLMRRSLFGFLFSVFKVLSVNLFLSESKERVNGHSSDIARLT